MSQFIYIPEDADKKTCVLVLSGGQDSVTCLGLAVQEFKHVHAIAFSYGQTHSVELGCAQRICEHFENVTFEIIPLDVLTYLGNSALIEGHPGSVNDEHATKKGLPASFVPNRNAMFLTIAHAYAQKVGACCVITGVCETDYSGYPDCRRDFIDAIAHALNIGSDSEVEIVTPLMYLTKADTFHLAEEYMFLDFVLNDSHTCYNGKRDGEFHHEWGHGCGECPACELRKKGFEEFLNGKAES